MAKSSNQTVHLPASVVADLNRLKIAFGFQTGRIYSYAEVISELISALEKANPAVNNIFRNINDSSMKLL